MTTDLTIGLIDRPGTLAQASDALGRAGVNIEGACGFVTDDRGVYHVLVRDAELARRALIDSGFEILAERTVVVLPDREPAGRGCQPAAPDREREREPGRDVHDARRPGRAWRRRRAFDPASGGRLTNQSVG